MSGYKYYDNDDEYRRIAKQVFGNDDPMDLMSRRITAEQKPSPPKEMVGEGKYYLMPTEIPAKANRAVLKAFFTGQAIGNVIPMELSHGVLVFAFDNEEDAGTYKMAGWEEQILEMLKY